MFREMRRKGQALPDEACKEILEKAPHGVLAVSGDGGWPYAVPLSFVYSAGTVYFHCACEGHKLDAVRRDARASFCVVDSDEVVAEEYTTYYRSVIAFGRVRELTGAEEKTAALRLLARRGEGWLAKLCAVKRADLDAHAQNEAVAARRAEVDAFEARMHALARTGCYTLARLKVGGGDALAAGIRPGPAVGDALHALLEAVMDGRLPNDREVLLAALRTQAEAD